MSNRSYIDIELPEMDLFLRQRRFKPVDVYYRRKPVKEWVYERKLPRHDNHFVRVYTSIQRYGRNRDSARDVGKDAIRVQVVYRDDKGETLVSMPKRVNRIATWKDNLNDRFEEIARTLPKVQFDRRGEPMTLRKKRGNLFWGSRDYPAYKETRSYGSEQEIMIGKPGEVAWRAINPNDYAIGLESGYLALDRTMGGGHYAMLGKTPATFQIHWKGYPMFEIDMEGLQYIVSANVQWNQPRHTNIQIMQDIPIEKVTPYDSDLGVGDVSGGWAELRDGSKVPLGEARIPWEKIRALTPSEVRRDRSWATRFDEVMEDPSFWGTYEYNSEDTTISRHQLIDDPDWLAGLESAIDSRAVLGDPTTVMFGPDWVDFIDELILRHPHGILIDSGSNNNPDYLGAFVILPMNPHNPLDWVLMEWDHIQSGGVDGIYDSKPMDDDYLDAKTGTNPKYDVTPFNTNIFNHLSHRGTNAWSRVSMQTGWDAINQASMGAVGTIPIFSAESEDSRKGVAVMVHDGMSSMIYPKISGTVYFEETDGGVRVDYQIRGLYDGPHGFHIHEYGDLTDGCTSACAHFNPDNMTHGGLDTKIRHFGDLGNIESKDRLAEGSLFLPDGRLDSSKYGILGRMIIVHADRDDLGKGGDEESLKTGNAGKRLACGVIGLADPKTFGFEAETVEFEADDNYDATYGKKQAKIRRRLKNKIMKKNMMGTPANKWSARKSQELKRQYEAACERAGLRPYKGKKTSKQQDLSDWSKQGWRTASGKKSSVTGEPYFPAKAVAALKKKGLYAKAKRQKAKAIKEKKNARYSDDIREVVGQYRAENRNYKICDNCGSENHLYVLDEETVCVTCIESYEDNWEQIFGRRPDVRGLGA